MRLQEFIDALYRAGWDSPSDAQWEKIAELHAEIFPSVAKLEKELRECLSCLDSNSK